MKKYKTNNGREVNLGEYILLKLSEREGYSKVQLTPEIAEHLLQIGLITDNTVEKKLNVQNLSLKMETLGYKVSAEFLTQMLRTPKNICTPGLLFITLLGLAHLLDEKYSNNIKEAKEFFTISMITGDIHKVTPQFIKGFNFPTFRTLEDAKIAKNFCKKALNHLFTIEYVRE